MTKRCSIFLSVTTAMLMSVAITPSQALELSGTLSGTVGSVIGGVTNTAGVAEGTNVNTVNGSAGAVASTLEATVGVLTPKSMLSADAKSTLLGGIMAKGRILSSKQLAKLCLTVGGGKQGCGSGDRPSILGLIDARLTLLKPNQLLGVCLTVGASCGNRRINGIGDGGGASDGGTQLVNISDNGSMAERKSCRSILLNPQIYDFALVRMCKRILLR